MKSLRFAEVEKPRLLPEALRLVGSIYCADDEPNESRILCPGLQADQQNETEYESETGYKRINKKIAMSNRFLGKPEVLQGRQVYAHERQQRSKRYHLRCAFPRNRQNRNIGQRANDPDVVHRIALFCAQVPEDSLGQHVIPSHAVEQSRRSHVSGESASNARNQKHDSIRRKKHRAAGLSRYIHEGRFGVLQGRMIRPDALCEVHLQPAEEPREYTNQYRGQLYIAFRVLYLFGEDRNAVEPDEHERRARCPGR